MAAKYLLRNLVCECEAYRVELVTMVTALTLTKVFAGAAALVLFIFCVNKQVATRALNASYFIQAKSMEVPSKFHLNTPNKRRVQSSITSNCLQFFKPLERKPSDENQTPNRKKTHICNLCDGPCNGTKEWNLAQHLRHNHPEIYAQIAPGIDPPLVDRLKFLQECVELVTVNGRPFACLSDSAFKSSHKTRLDKLHEAGCGFSLSNPNQKEVKDHLIKMSKQVRLKITNEVADKPLSILVDIVTKQQRSILGVSLQYALNGVLKIRSIGAIELCDLHTGEYLAKLLIERLKALQIDLKQIITITTDNGANVLKMVRDVEHELQAETNNVIQKTQLQDSNENDFSNEAEIDAAIDQILAEKREISDEEALEQVFEEVQFENQKTLLNIMSSELEQLGANIIWDITGMNCAEHTLQLMIKDGLKKLSTENINLVDLCREVCKMLRLHSTRNEMAKMGIEYRLPRMENQTRWGSMYMMVISILK